MNVLLRNVRGILTGRRAPAPAIRARVRAMRPIVARIIVALVAVVVSPAVSRADGPIKIGFISPMSGAIAQAGKDMYSGCELYWQETGWQVAGRKLEVILE